MQALTLFVLSFGRPVDVDPVDSKAADGRRRVDPNGPPIGMDHRLHGEFDHVS
jgi:hypothetical protein